jgi:hypothetical protein
MHLSNGRDLSDAQWVGPLIPEPLRRMDGRGRPWKDRRRVLGWVLRTGAPWAELPDRYPSYQTCHHRFQQWVRSGIMRCVLEALAENLPVRGQLDVSEAFIDGSFAPSKKGAPRSGRPNVVREPKSWLWQTGTVFRSPCASKATPSQSDVGRAHPDPDGWFRCSAESGRRQHVSFRQTGGGTQALRDRTNRPASTQSKKQNARRTSLAKIPPSKIERLFA